MIRIQILNSSISRKPDDGIKDFPNLSFQARKGFEFEQKLEVVQVSVWFRTYLLYSWIVVLQISSFRRSTSSLSWLFTTMNHWVRRSKQEAIGPNFSLFGVAPKHCLVFTPTKALLLNSQLPSMSLKLITLSRCRCRNATKLSRARIGFLVSCLETLLWYNDVKSSVVEPPFSWVLWKSRSRLRPS